MYFTFDLSNRYDAYVAGNLRVLLLSHHTSSIQM